MICKLKENISVFRKKIAWTGKILVGDQLLIGNYTATCQEITEDGNAVFLLDQYLDKDYQMNREYTNEGGYKKSDLREKLNSEEVLEIFENIRERMVPFENGDLIRIPFYGEIFGEEDVSFACPESDGHAQWPLMKDRKNRIALRQNHWNWGWLQNRRKDSATNFCAVTHDGGTDNGYAFNFGGVRLVFLIGR